MKALVLAAGKGTRLLPYTKNIPKVMIPINGKPILEYHIDQLSCSDIKDIYINLHYHPNKIENYFEDGKKWGLNIRYSREPKILGTAGAIKKLEPELGDDAFLVVYGDNFFEMNYKDFVAFSESKTGIGVVVAFKKDDVQGSGILEIGDEDQILRFKEKPNPSDVFSHWVNAGVFYFRKEIFEFIPRGVSDFGHDVFPEIIKVGKKLYAYKLEQDVCAIDNIDLLIKLRNRVKRKKRLMRGQDDYHKDSI